MSKLTNDLVLFCLVLILTNASAERRGCPLRPDFKLYLRVHRQADSLESCWGHLSHRGRRSAAVAPDEGSFDEEAVTLCRFFSNLINVFLHRRSRSVSPASSRQNDAHGIDSVSVQYTDIATQSAPSPRNSSLTLERWRDSAAISRVDRRSAALT